MNKICSKCGEEKDIYGFSKSKVSRDGFCAWCKACYTDYQKTDKRKAYQKQYRESVSGKTICKKYRQSAKGRESHKKSNHKHYQTAKGKEAAIKRAGKWKKKNPEKSREIAIKGSTEWQKRNPEKIKAHNVAKCAVRAGKLTRLPCEICGSTKDVHAHHEIGRAHV